MAMTHARRAVRWPCLTPCSASRRWTSGRRRGLGTPARIIGNASLLHRLALSVCTFGAEEALRSLGLLSRVVPGLGAEVLRAFVEFVEVFARMGPVVIVGTKSCMPLIIRAFCILSRLLMSLYFNAGVFEGSPPSGGANGLHPYLLYDLTVAELKRLTARAKSGLRAPSPSV